MIVLPHGQYSWLDVEKLFFLNKEKKKLSSQPLVVFCGLSWYFGVAELTTPSVQICKIVVLAAPEVFILSFQSSLTCPEISSHI